MKSYEQIENEAEIFFSIIDTMKTEDVAKYIADNLCKCRRSELNLLAAQIHRETGIEPIEKVIPLFK